MKLRPVLLVILLLAGFYFVTTHLASTGTLAQLLGAPRAAGNRGGWERVLPPRAASWHFQWAVSIA